MTARFATKSLIVAGLLALAATGCADDDRVLSPVDPMVPGPVDPPDDGAGGERPDDLGVGDCEDGAIRTCKIQIDENNCFVGAQQCMWGEWGDCLDPDDLDEDIVAASETNEADEEDEDVDEEAE